MMRISRLGAGLVWSVLSRWQPWLQHPDWASGIWGVDRVGGWEPGGPEGMSWRGQGSPEVMGESAPICTEGLLAS